MIQFFTQDILNFIDASGKLVSIDLESYCRGKKQPDQLQMVLTSSQYYHGGLKKGFGGSQIAIQPLNLTFYSQQKLSKMKQIAEKTSIQSQCCSCDQGETFIVVHGYRHLMAKERRKALRKANNNRKKMLSILLLGSKPIESPDSSPKNVDLMEESLWDVFNLEDVDRFSIHHSSTEHHPLSLDNQWDEGRKSKGSLATSLSDDFQAIKMELFAQWFQPFSYPL